MMNANAKPSQVTLEVHPPMAKEAVLTITGAVDQLHQDPKRIHQLLDLLNMPKGTEVRVVTMAATSIVR
jgi:hypothetical protein